MKFTIAIDSFKGSLSSYEAGLAVKRGILNALPNAEVSVFPIADGGEGTVDALAMACDGEYVEITVHDPLSRPIKASYVFSEKRKLAVIEMSAAAGLPLLSKEERNPMKATTFGVGEMIIDAINRGARRFIVGIGGSATNDGGIGMLSALGYRFLDNDGNLLVNGAEVLSKLAKIETDSRHKKLAECDFLVACDVKNPLTGALGCSRVFAPQKGATESDIEKMDSWLEKYADMTASINPEANKNYPGVGAAGGLGFAFSSYLGAKLKPGIELIIDEIGIEDSVKDSDFVITGEGRLDGQSCMGKTPVGVARVAKKYGKPVIAFAGAVTPDAGECNLHGIDAFFSITRGPISLAEAMESECAKANLSATAEQAIRLVCAVK